MPIYNFQCKSCGGSFKRLMRITDDSIPECPECASAEVIKLISLSSFHLKGNGWYKTDYAGGGNGGNGGNGETKPKPKEESPCSSCEKAADKSCPQAS